MFAIRPSAASLLLVATALLITGCLERKETIRVDRNGSVTMRVELEGDPSDFATYRIET